MVENQKKKKHAGGRPTKYKKVFIEQGRKLVALGATDVQISDFFKITEATLTNWKKKHPEFFASLKESKEEMDSKVVRSLFERAMGYEHKDEFISQYKGEIITAPIIKKYAPDTTAQIFWLKNRQPDKWRDKQDHNITSDQPINLNIQINGKVEKA